MKLLGHFTACLLALGVSMPTSATILTYDTILSGSNESPANGSPATGNAVVTIDTGADTMEVSVVFAGLSAPDTAAHIHCCTAAPGTGNASVATVTPTFTGFPTGVTSGTYDHVFDMTLASSYNPSFVTAEGSVSAAETALFSGIAAGDAYLNIHTTAFAGGEIRGFLTPCGGTTGNICGPDTTVPEPATLALLGLGLASLAASRQRKS